MTVLHYFTFLAAGVASYYDLPGNVMADGNIFNPRAHVCAMRFVPLETNVVIVNADNGRESSCIVRDRGPFVAGRVIDVSPIVKEELGMGGLASVRVYERH